MVASRSWGDDITHILLAGVHMDVDIQENVRLISEPVHRGVQTNPPFHPGQLKSPALAWLSSFVAMSSALTVDLAFEHCECELTIAQ